MNTLACLQTPLSSKYLDLGEVAQFGQSLLGVLGVVLLLDLHVPQLLHPCAFREVERETD